MTADEDRAKWLEQCARNLRKWEKAAKPLDRKLRRKMAPHVHKIYKDKSVGLIMLLTKKVAQYAPTAEVGMQIRRKAYEIFVKKDPETCLAEMPEVPNKDRLSQLQQQCKAELAQLIMMVEQARQGVAGEAAAGAAASEATGE